MRAGGVTGRLNVRADSGFYSKKVVARLPEGRGRWSITVKLYQQRARRYLGHPRRGVEADPLLARRRRRRGRPRLARRSSPRSDAGVACRLVVRRTKPTPGSQLALLVD